MNNKQKNFNVGDRVVYVGYSNESLVPKGSVGTVVLLAGGFVGVEFDDNIGGHSFGLKEGVKCKAGHGWYVYPDSIEPIKEYADEDYHYEYSEPLSSHYETTLQPIEFMQANMTHEEFIGFLKGNIIKYTARCGKKDDVDKEVAKIIEYAKWLAKAYKGETINPRES